MSASSPRKPNVITSKCRAKAADQRPKQPPASRQTRDHHDRIAPTKTNDLDGLIAK